jgi:hypothetical protein
MPLTPAYSRLSCASAGWTPTATDQNTNPMMAMRGVTVHSFQKVVAHYFVKVMLLADEKLQLTVAAVQLIVPLI